MESEVVEQYGQLREKYGLPDLDELSRNFSVDKTLDKDSDFLLRDVRMAIGEKISAYLHLLEVFLNPASPPVFVFSIMRELSDDDKAVIKKAYKALSKLQVRIMVLETKCDEKDEAEFIVHSFEAWKAIQNEMVEVIGKFEGYLDKEDVSGERAYFN